MKIKLKYQLFFFVLLVATPLTFTLSFCNTLIATGFTGSFYFIWMKNWGISFLVAYPTALLVASIAKRIVSKIEWT
jgi:hypothetical protein